MLHRCAILLLPLTLAVSVSAVAAEQPTSQTATGVQALPEYQPRPLESTSLTSVGSDSMGGLVTSWVAAYRTIQPLVRLQVVSRGSAMAPAALVEGTADLGPMARPMKSDEREEFVSKYGFEPTQVRTALSAVAVYVSEENPLEEISIEELDRIYSEKPARSTRPSIQEWKQLGVRGTLGSERIVPIGLVKDSYATAYFKQRVLLQQEFSSARMSVSNQDALFESVTSNPSTIAVGNYVAEVPAGVKLLRIAKEKGDTSYLPTEETIATLSYPLSRYLNIYVVRTPGETLESSTADFLRFVLSRQGQSLVSKEGMLPLPLTVVTEELAKLK